MNNATKDAYRGLARYFIETRLGEQTPTPKRLADALSAAAPDYRPDYWRRLRNALEFDQREKGYPEAADRIRGTVNPVTKTDSKIAVKPKQRRVKHVTDADEDRLLQYLQGCEDFTSISAIVVAKITGARPSEMLSIRIHGRLLSIEGVKKSHQGQRGMDRSMVLDEEVLYMVRGAIDELKGANIGAIQDRIAAAGRRLWPQRTARPSLYSWRHQLGSNLKASGLSRVEIAYLMGHQSTESVEKYGNRRTARPGAVLPRAPEGADFSLVRERHTAVPQAIRAAHDSPEVEEKQEFNWGW